MVRDYTDFLLFIFDSGERVYHLVHLRNRKGLELNGKTYPMNGHKYLLNLDRAYRIKWTPWKKFDWNKVKWTFNELTRSKKVGILFYQEPSPPREIRVVTDCECSCGFKGKTMTGTKVHIASAQQTGQGSEHTIKEIVSTQMVNVVKGPIEPMHISRIHQPSGVMKG